jgi:hypothetical protein
VTGTMARAALMRLVRGLPDDVSAEKIFQAAEVLGLGDEMRAEEKKIDGLRDALRNFVADSLKDMERQMIYHKKAFGIYHWDTFDNKAILIDEADTQVEAEEKVLEKYKDRINDNGADQVDIVNVLGEIVNKFKVS